MRVSDEGASAPVIVATPAPEEAAEAAAWADRSRRVLTRDLLVRARHARPGERRALEFRVLHLNLVLVTEVTERLGVTRAECRRLEHHALEALHEAVQRYDPYDEPDFAEVAGVLIEERLRPRLLRLSVVTSPV